MDSVRRGDRGPAVAEIRTALQALALIPSGEAALDPRSFAAQVFDDTCELAVRSFQQQRGLIVTGEVDPDTYRMLIEARFRLGDRVLHYVPARMQRGDDVTALQDRLAELGYDTRRVDGIFGQDTASALTSFQEDSGLVADGTCGPQTLRALSLLGRKVTGGSPVRLRQKDFYEGSGPALIGRRIALDAAHGGETTGLVVDGVSQADLAWDIARRTEGRLSIMGAVPILTRGPEAEPTHEERAAVANDMRAELLVSVHVAGHPSPQANGVATYYWGTSTVGSDVGEEFAGLLQRELRVRTGFLDLASHPRHHELLRLTRMPAVLLEVGYLTNAADRERLRRDEFRDVISEAIVAAVQRFYLTDELDVATGTWTFPADLFS